MTQAYFTPIIHDIKFTLEYTFEDYLRKTTCGGAGICNICKAGGVDILHESGVCFQCYAQKITCESKTEEDE